MITPELALTRIRDFRLHPLGFFYLRVEAGEGITSRFHIWPVSEFGVPETSATSTRSIFGRRSGPGIWEVSSLISRLMRKAV